MNTQTGDTNADGVRMNDPFEERTAAKPRRRKKAGGGVWRVAATASLVWVAAVGAFLWGAYQLPLDMGEGIARLQAQLSATDMLILATVLIVPLMMIWLIAAVWQRSTQMRSESYMLAEAAMRLAKAAETSERRGDVLLPGPSLINEISSPSPGHFRREVERATHAISALHAQMSAIEEALANQSATIDAVAERAENRAKTITETLRAERVAIAKVADELSIERQAIATPVADGVALGSVKAQVEAAEAHVEAASVRLAAVAEPLTAEQAPEPVQTTSDTLSQPLTDIPRAPDIGIAEAPDIVPDDGLTMPQAPSISTALDDGGDRKRQLEELRRDMASLQTQEPETTISTADDPRRPLDPFDDLAMQTATTTLGEPTIEKRLATALGGGGAALAAGVATAAAATSATVKSATTSATDMAQNAATTTAGAVKEAAAGPILGAPRKLDWDKVIRAANFPDNDADHETLDALYDVLTDPQAAALLQVAEDTLATLAEIDLYMEDFRPRVSPVAAWQGFLDGKTATEAGLAGLDIDIERSRVAAKIDADPSFAGLAARFTERYEEMLRRLFDEGAEPKLVLDLSDTRTGRAYLLVAEASGRLD